MSTYTKTLCVNVHDNKYGTQLAKHLYPKDQSKLDPSLKNIDGISYLFGTVIGQTKKRAGKGLSYDVQWEDSTLGITSVDVALVLSAVELCKKVSKNNDEGPFSPDGVFNEHVLSYLTNHVETGEEGDPLDSDDDDGVEEIVTSNPIQFGARHEPEGAQFLLPEELHKSNTGGPKRDNGLCFKWRADTEIPEPVGISRDKTTTVKPEYTSFFSSPINSFCLLSLSNFSRRLYSSPISMHTISCQRTLIT